jgi:hypothetical protein
LHSFMSCVAFVSNCFSEKPTASAFSMWAGFCLG